MLIQSLLLWWRCQHCTPAEGLRDGIGINGKSSEQEQSNTISVDIYSDRHGHCPGTATFIYYFAKRHPGTTLQQMPGYRCLAHV